MDLNCDLGEGLDIDAKLMPYLGSCNIACGGHYGNDDSIIKAINLAKKFGVKTGAHPSYPDTINFGRRKMDISEEKLTDSLLNQIQCFQKHCKDLDYPMHHIKPHGALYNHAANDAKTARLILDLMSKYFPDSFLYCPPQSIFEIMAKGRGINHKLEAFADRGYQDDLSLLPRTHPKALLVDPGSVIAHIHPIIRHQRVKTISGKMLPLEADTLCVHGDNPNAVSILEAITREYKF